MQRRPIAIIRFYFTVRQKALLTQKARFKVSGMYCTSCKPIVEKQLKGERAVKKIDIDYMTDSVVVEYDSNLISKEEIKKRLESSGYTFSRVAI